MLLILFCLPIFTAHAGIVGLITARTRSWQYVQQTGGIRIGQPTHHEGHVVLPVEYDPTGIMGITVRPAVMESGQAVRRVEIKRADDNQLVLKVITQVVEEGVNTGRMHFANLSNIPAGSYEVYYGEAGDREKYLGTIQVL